MARFRARFGAGPGLRFWARCGRRFPAMCTGLGRCGRRFPAMCTGLGRCGRRFPAMCTGLGRCGRRFPAMCTGLGRCGAGAVSPRCVRDLAGRGRCLPANFRAIAGRWVRADGCGPMGAGRRLRGTACGGRRFRAPCARRLGPGGRLSSFAEPGDRRPDQRVRRDGARSGAGRGVRRRRLHARRGRGRPSSRSVPRRWPRSYAAPRRDAAVDRRDAASDRASELRPPSDPETFAVRWGTGAGRSTRGGASAPVHDPQIWVGRSP